MNAFGIYRHLTQCSSPQGHFTILAIDHRGVLVSDMEKGRGRAVTSAEVVEFKNAVARYLLPAASAILTDPDYGFGGVLGGDISGQAGLLAPLEVTNYNVHPSQRQADFIQGWGVEKIKYYGATGVKLLLYFHPQAANAAAQTALVDRIIEQCQQQALPFFLEPIAYSLDPQQPLAESERRQVVIESARHFSGRGITVLKTEFPYDPTVTTDTRTWLEALQELNSACQAPWALLSGGTSFETFVIQTQLACQAGASGVMVGRAVWAEAVKLEGAAMVGFLETTGYHRMKVLNEVCREYGTSWKQKIAAPALAEGWYTTS
jgi:tagatose-1,6-bisphosphate aldolase